MSSEHFAHPQFSGYFFNVVHLLRQAVPDGAGFCSNYFLSPVQAQQLQGEWSKSSIRKEFLIRNSLGIRKLFLEVLIHYLYMTCNQALNPRSFSLKRSFTFRCLTADSSLLSGKHAVAEGSAPEYCILAS